MLLEKKFAQVSERQAGVENVLDDEDVFAFDGLVEILNDFDCAGRALAVAVAGDRDEVEGGICLNGAGEIDEKNAAPLSTPTMTSFSPLRSRVICAPISATRSAICWRE